MTEYALLAAMIGLTFAGCASAPSIDQAIAVHNIYRSVLLDLDAAYKPVLSEAEARAEIQADGDSTAFVDAMRPWTLAVEALTYARQTEQAIHLSIRKWKATGKDAVVLRETYACAAAAVDNVAAAFGALPHGSPLYAAAFAIATQLRSMADGANCGVKP